MSPERTVAPWPGRPSGTGKPRQPVAWANRWGYVTDETVIVEATIASRPTPAAVDHRRREPAGHKEEFSPDTLGLGPTRRTRPWARSSSRRDPRSRCPTSSCSGLPEAMIATIPETSALPKIPMPLARWPERCARGWPLSIGLFGDRRLRGRVDRTDRGPTRWCPHVTGSGSTCPTTGASLSTPLDDRLPGTRSSPAPRGTMRSPARVRSWSSTTTSPACSIVSAERSGGSAATGCRLPSSTRVVEDIG